jgi:hypothetical protein
MVPPPSFGLGPVTLNKGSDHFVAWRRTSSFVAIDALSQARAALPDRSPQHAMGATSGIACHARPSSLWRCAQMRLDFCEPRGNVRSHELTRPCQAIGLPHSCRSALLRAGRLQRGAWSPPMPTGHGEARTRFLRSQLLRRLLILHSPGICISRRRSLQGGRRGVPAMLRLARLACEIALGECPNAVGHP